MTVSTTTSRADYTGNGVTTAFTVPFYFLDNTHLLVLRTQISTGAITTLTLSADYTVTGAGVAAGGTVTCLSAPTSDQKLSILRNIPLTQLTHYVENDPFPAASHERALDQLTMEVQQVNEAVGRALTLAKNTPSSTASTELPTPSSNKLLGWNQTATGLQNVDPITLATIVAFGTAKADVFSGNGSQTVFTLTANPGALNNLDVSISGVTQKPVIDYTWTGGLTLTFTSAPPSGSQNILVRYLQGLPQGYTTADLVQYTPYGTNPPTTNLETVYRRVFNVKDYGAIGDGATDDTAAIQKALAAIELYNKSFYPPYPIDPRDTQRCPALYFPVGFYKVTSTSLVRGPIIFMGEGQTWAANPAIIAWAPVSIFKFEGTFWDNYIGLGVHVENVRFGHQQNISDPGNPYYDPAYATKVNQIAALEFPASSTTPGWSNGGVTGSLGSNSLYFKNCRYGAQSWGSFILIDHADDVVMDGCCIDACQGLALQIKNNAANVRITNNDFFSSGSSLGSVNIGSGFNLSIAGNNFYTQTGHTAQQIQIGSSADTAINCSNVSIKGNTFKNVAPVKLFSNIDGADISGNICSDLASPLVTCETTTGGLRTAKKVKIANNTLTLASGASPNASILALDQYYLHDNFEVYDNFSDASAAAVAGVPALYSATPNILKYDFIGDNNVIVPSGKRRYGSFMAVKTGSKSKSKRATFIASTSQTSVSSVQLELCAIQIAAQGYITLDVQYDAQVGQFGGAAFSQSGYISNFGQVVLYKTNNTVVLEQALITTQFPTAFSFNSTANDLITPAFSVSYSSGVSTLLLTLTVPTSHSAFIANASCAVASCSNGYGSQVLINGY